MQHSCMSMCESLAQLVLLMFALSHTTCAIVLYLLCSADIIQGILLLNYINVYLLTYYILELLSKYSFHKWITC